MIYRISSFRTWNPAHHNTIQSGQKNKGCPKSNCLNNKIALAAILLVPIALFAACGQGNVLYTDNENREGNDNLNCLLEDDARLQAGARGKQQRRGDNVLR